MSMDYPFEDEAFGRLAADEVAPSPAGSPVGRARPSCAETARSNSRSPCSAWISGWRASRSSTKPPRRSRGRRVSTRSTCRPRRSAASCPCDPIAGSSVTTVSVAIALRCRTPGRAGSGSRRNASRSPTSRTRRRSRRSSRCRPTRRSSTTRTGRPASLATPGRAGTSTTCATTTSSSSSASIRPASDAHDHDRYLELSRAVTGEVMAHVFGEWRRAGSPSGGGMILWLRDLVAGAG